MILYRKGELGAGDNSGLTISYSPGADGQGEVLFESFDNFDDIGRPPGRFEERTMTLEDFLEGHRADDPAVLAYHRLVAEGLIEPPAWTLQPVLKTRPPALDRPVTRPGDPNKGRFGGRSEKDGFVLAASFRKPHAESVEIVLTVTAPPGAGLEELDRAEFHLHDSFDPDVLTARLRDGVATRHVIAYAGFTVGAWIARTGTELELDLAELQDAPRIIGGGWWERQAAAENAPSPSGRGES
jgi:hypothetical protein